MWCAPADVAELLTKKHYLGATRRGMAWRDEFGAIVFAKPTSRRLPVEWLELSRWCIDSEQKNAGSRQWGSVIRHLRHDHPEITTIVSYSDPSVGHTGALYRACNWIWAPTWHRLRPPPTGNGAWQIGAVQSVKDRWVFLVAPDSRRLDILTAKDEAILKKWPWSRYTEPAGVPFKNWLAAIA